MKEHLLIFARAPRLGTVKTRLAREIGEERAFVAYLQLLQALCGNLHTLSNVTLLVTPDDGAPELRGLVPDRWSIQGQGSGDLGERLTRAFEQALEKSGRVLAIGSDCPYVTREDVEAAFEALGPNDVVLGPALDGGYWLVGMNGPHPALFKDIEWSTSTVLADTLKRADALGLRTALLRRLSDVDTAADWEAFRASMPP